MGLFGTIGKRIRTIRRVIRKTYRKVDTSVGGRLPGGVSVSKPSTTSKPSAPSRTTTRTTPSPSVPSRPPTPLNNLKPIPKDINVLQSGAIRVGKITYHGKAIVPYSGGKTANQIQRETFIQARSQGITKRGTYTATIPIALPKISSKKISRPSKIPVKRISKPKESFQQLKERLAMESAVKRLGIKKAQEQKLFIAKLKRKLAKTKKVKVNKKLEIKKIVSQMLKSKIERTLQLKKIKPLSKAFIKTADIVSGGAITSSRFKKRETAINKEIEIFNKKYTGKKLSESEYNKSLQISSQIEKRERTLKVDKAKLEKSFARKYIGGWIWGTGEHSLEGKIAKQSLTKENIKNLEKELKTFKTKKGKAKSKINIKRLDSLIKGKEKEIKDRKTGIPAKLIQGMPPPILPAAIMVPKTVNIKFIGKQVRKGNKIITDIIFKEGSKRVGMARGVTVTKGSKGTSIVLGKSGVVGYKFPSGKLTIKQIRSFVGRETAATRKANFMIKQNIELLKKSKKIGRIDVIKKNIKGLQQVGIGRSATVKGQKFYKTGIKFPSGKFKTVKAKGIKVDDFASLSSIFTKKDLSLIIGKTITAKSGKANFIGLIKGTSKVGKNFRISSGQQQQFNQALQKVISVASGSLTKAGKIKGLSKVGTIAQAGATIKIGLKKPTTPKPTTPKLKAPTKIITKVVPKIITKPITKITQVQIQKIKQYSTGRAKQVLKQVVKEETKIKQQIKFIQKSKVKTKSKIRAAQKIRVKQKQLQKQRSRLASIQQQKQVLKQVTKKVRIARSPRVIRPIRPLPIPKKTKRIIRKTITKKKPTTGYYVYEKRGKNGKFTKLKGLPLTKKQAKDKLAFRVGNKSSRTVKLVPVKKVKKFGKITAKQKGYFNKYKKNLRDYKIVKGKRVKTPGTYIEKRGKALIDTPGEKRQLALNRRAKAKLRTIKRTAQKKITRKTRKPVRRTTRRQTPIKRTAQKRIKRPTPIKRSKSKNTRRSKKR